MIEFRVEDTKAQGYLATPASGSGPGVLVLHAWWGLNEVFTGLCDRLAAEGFVAFAPDFYSGRVATTVEDAEALMGTLEDEPTANLVRAAAAYLRDLPATTGDGLGTIGFSMGAMWASLLATVFNPDDIDAVVLFYGVGYIGADEYSRSHAAFQAHFAPGDPFATDEEVEPAIAAIEQGGRAITTYQYEGTHHWFFESNRPEYDAQAAALAWERTVAFLREHVEA